MINLMDHSSRSTFRIEPMKQHQPGQTGRGGMVFLSANWEFRSTSEPPSDGQSQSVILCNLEEGKKAHDIEP